MLTQPVRKLRSGTCIWYAALSAGSNLLPLKPHPLQDGEEPGEERRVRNTQGFPSGGDGQSPAQKRREWVGGSWHRACQGHQRTLKHAGTVLGKETHPPSGAGSQNWKGSWRRSLSTTRIQCAQWHFTSVFHTEAVSPTF